MARLRIARRNQFLFPWHDGRRDRIRRPLPNELFEARYFRGHRADISDEAIDREQSGWFYELLYTRFWANSFYTSSGVGYRSLDFLLKDDPEKAGSYALERTDAGLLLSLGNRWQWEHFTLGAEWAGVFLPAKAIHERRIVSPAVDGDDALEKEGREADGYRKVMVGMLAVHAGAAF